MQVIPAILPHSFEEITEKLDRTVGITDLVQIDLCDGIFGREKTWLPVGREVLPSNFSYEFDVMLTDWKTYIPKCIDFGSKRIVVHVDDFEDGDMAALVAMIAPSEIALGISVSNDETVEYHADMIRQARDLYPHVYVQVMGIEIVGEQGQLFDESCVERIIALKKLFGDIDIQVDGAMKPDTAARVFKAGADTAVVGSYMYLHEDVENAYNEFASIEHST